MKFSTLSNGFIASTLLAVQALADCSYIAGNYYCSEIQAVTYENIGFSGSYQEVTAMNADGSCNFDSKSFSGTNAPLDQDLSVHFRGPLNLKQFAVYYPSSSSLNKRDDEEKDCSSTRVHHVHHNHKREADPVFVTQTVQVTQIVQANVAAPTVSAADAASSSVTGVAESVLVSNAPVASVQVGPGFVPADSDSLSSSVVASSPSVAEPSATASNPASNIGGWARSSYFDASSSSSSNLAFLNNLGGTAGSGVWSSSFGNSLSYCGKDGVSSSSESQTLGDVTIPSNSEYIIFSGEKCSGNSCGYYREGIPAYKGFSGSSKLFVFEFQMPTDTTSDSSVYNHDMPAIWLLNGKIPRTSQYSSCSCWKSGCGEFDIFEVLNSGNDKLTNHLHTWQGTNSLYGGGGTSDYFTRPLSSTMKAGVLFNGDKKTISIFQIADDGTFGENVSDSTLSSWLSGQSASVFISS
ncbi:hypothetical protein NADFUDRAFT_83577 [Nadsonia fulvescens var. elongata DSM 6958]|uniref:glucan endo-1,3-beta-D-glucosidase n=1 Tax=Nadsonia fulvescens var. elongata DSM 6958 TaxID=857566 RepID=A0A1E3PH68_9ASCO|nr:hypothetical protein NADFUDRAFT_83577 [Nadsonia fulvescens var. elongata DSM 6958]